MEKNCLVTRLKGVVQSGNHIELNTIYFDYPGGYDVTKDVTLNICIKTGDSPVDIELSFPMHPNAYANTAISSMTLEANSSVNLITKAADIGSERISKLLKISGGIYELKCLSSNGYSDYSSIDCAPTQENSIASLKFNENLITFGGTNVDYKMLPDSLKYLVIGAADSNSINIDNIPVGVQKISTPKVITGSTYSQILQITEATKRLTGLRVIDARIEGDIANLPTGVKILNRPSNQLTGAIEDFVAATGKSSGCICFRGATDTFWRVTLGGTRVSSLENIPTNLSPYYYLSWNNGTYTWETTVPESMALYRAITTQAPKDFVPVEE